MISLSKYFFHGLQTNFYKKNFLILSILFSSNFAHSQLYESGTPFIKNFTAKQYNYHDQNWSVVQDKRHVLYFANSLGLLTYDGFKWDVYAVNNESRLRSLAIDSIGRIYYGAEGEFGYLSITDKGNISFENLTKLLPKTEKKINEVWSIFSSKNYVYFCTRFAIYVYQNNNLKTIWHPHSSHFFHKFFMIDGDFFVRESERGLLIENNNELLKIDGTEKLESTKLDVMFGNKNLYLLGVRGESFYSMSVAKKGNTFSAKLKTFKTEADFLFNKTDLYCGVELRNGLFAIGTETEGIVIIDSVGKLMNHITNKNGLNSNRILFLYEDGSNSIWAALEKGLSVIDYSTPFRKFDESNGLHGNINATIKFNNIIYAASSEGLFYCEDNLKTNKEFVLFPKTTECFSFLNFCTTTENKIKENKLLFASIEGIFEIKKNNSISVVDTSGSFLKLYQPSYLSNTFFGGSSNYLAKFSFSNNQFHLEKEYPNLEGELRSFTSDNNKNLFIGAEKNGIYVLDLEKNADVKLIENSKKINQSSVFDVFNLNNRIYVGTSNGIFNYNYKSEKVLSGKFISTKLISDNISNSKFSVFRTQTDYSNVWLAGDYDGKHITGFAKNNGKYTFSFSNRVFNKIDRQVNNIYVENPFYTWISTNDGIFKFYRNKRENCNNTAFSSLINLVKIKNGDILFYGNFYWKINAERIPSITQTEENKIIIPYAQNSVYFELAATDFLNKEQIQFSTFLENFDESYSEWLKDNHRDFTNLREGQYIFYVKAKDVFGNISKPTQFKFSIETPWYRSYLAYVIYILLIVYFIYLIVKINTKRLQIQNENLEKTVLLRTSEIQQQKTEIEIKNIEITDSINYAKIIQTAALPQISEIKESFNECFVYFNPRNIVSGDFYWFAKTEKNIENILRKRIFIACADCTGHGVPGAFMSMMGMEKLTQSTKELQHLAPSKILSFVNIGIKQSLGQTSQLGKSKDGMEMVLCEFDLEQNKVYYSGANRPLWIIRKTENKNFELFVYKPTKAGIAGYTENEQIFEQTEIDLQFGDTIYLFSDGAVDQFGGAFGKKLMTVGFRNLLLTIQHQNMNDQFETINSYYKSWMGDLEQVDDILIIGIKI